MNIRHLIMMFTAVWFSLAMGLAAQPSRGGFSTQQIEGRAIVPVPPGQVVEPPLYRPGGISAQIWTDRSSYRVGDRVRVYFRVNQDANVFIFNTDASGRRTQIFPNWFDQQNRIRGGFTYAIPDGSYDLQVQPPAGNESLTILAVADDFPELRMWYHSYSAQNPFPTRFKAPEELARELEAGQWVRPGQGNVPPRRDMQPMPDNRANPGFGNIGAPPDQRVEARAIVPVPPQPPQFHPHPVPAPRFAMATIGIQTFDVAQPPVVVPTPGGWLHINTRPHSGEVYINGSYQGRAPLTLSLPAGEHDVELRRNGFRSEFRRVFVQPGQSVSLNVRFEPEYRLQSDLNFGDWGFQFQYREQN